MRLKASLRPISSSLRCAAEVALALDRQALDQQAGGDLVVGREHQPRVELLGLQHVVLEHLRQLLQRLAPVAVQRHHALVGLLAGQLVLRVERDRAAALAVHVEHRLQLRVRRGTSPTTLAVARNARSGCTSATASLTGPSPNTCRISAPLNLMLACISAPAAAISPSSARTGGGKASSAPARRAQHLLPAIGQAHQHAAHRQAFEEELVQLATSARSSSGRAR